MMTRIVALSLLTLLSASCKKDDKAAPDKAAETRPAEPAPKPEPVAPAPAAGGLATIAIPGAKTATDKVLTGGQPTDQHLQQAKDSGVKTVVNLRSEGEQADYATEPKKVEELGMKYFHIPIDGKTGEGLNEENAKKLAALLSDDQKPMIVHCASGERAGALMALKAFYVDGATPEVALKTGRDNGLSKPHLEKVVTDLMAKGAPAKPM